MGDATPSHAIVSCFDQNYYWGAFLLVASLRRNAMRMPIYLLTSGLSEEEKDRLTQFGDVHVTQLDASSQMGNSLQKPEAIMLASDYDIITWMDADCMVTGDVTPLLSLENKGLMIRFRKPAENKKRFKTFHMPDGSTPQVVLDSWREDVGEEEEPRTLTTCSANVFSIGRDHLPFILHWKKQIAAMRNMDPAMIKRSYPFSTGVGMGDELILNSLLAFAHDVPPISEFTLDKDPDRMLIHFVLRPKPWERWSLTSLKHRDLIKDTLDWVAQNGFKSPEIPEHIYRASRLSLYARAAMGDFFDKAKRARARLPF